MKHGINSLQVLIPPTETAVCNNSVEAQSQVLRSKLETLDFRLKKPKGYDNDYE